jgi:hypothetical protein
MQGYYFAKPMPRTAPETFIKTYKPKPILEEDTAQRMAATA